MILGLLPSYLKDYLIQCDNLRTYLTRSSTLQLLLLKELKLLNHPSSHTELTHGEILLKNLEIKTR